MNISPKERFLDICHFKRPGDLYTADGFWVSTLEEWVKQGAPEQIMDYSFHLDYFQFQSINSLAEFHFLFHKRRLDETNSSALGDDLEESSSEIDLGHGIRVSTKTRSPAVPAYQPRIISEDESTVTLINVAGQTVKYIKGRLESMMPTYLDWPVKDRATWNDHKKRLDPNTPGRWPSDWNAYVREMNGKSEPISLGVGRQRKNTLHVL